MKSIFKITKNGKEFFLSANLTIGVIRLEKEYDCKVEPTGLDDDSFGRGVVRNYGCPNIADLKMARKILKEMSN